MGLLVRRFFLLGTSKYCLELFGHCICMMEFLGQKLGGCIVGVVLRLFGQLDFLGFLAMMEDTYN